MASVYSSTGTLPTYSTPSGRGVFSSSAFTSELKSLSAFIKTTSTDGDIDETSYSDLASIVYLRGSIISPTSIKAEYIAHGKETDEDYYNGGIKGIVVGVDDIDKEITILILNSYYHQILTLPCETMNHLYANSIEEFNIILKSYREDTKPISCKYAGNTLDIDESVIEQARLEHEIYENTINK